MAWIESHTVLIRHRKLLLMASDLGIEPVLAMGHLHALWHAVLEQQEDGDLSQWSDQMIAYAGAYRDGDPRRFVAVLIDRGWIDPNRKIHDWIDYAGHFLIKKYSTSNPIKLKDIWKLYGYKYGKRDNKSLFRIANRKRTESEQKANLPNLTLPNLTLPNQPKEKTLAESHKKTNGSPPTEWSQEDLWLKDFLNSQKYVPHNSALLDPQWWEALSVGINGISHELLEREFAKMGAWIAENPSRRPTPKGIRRFVRHWLERAYEQERKQPWLHEKRAK